MATSAMAPLNTNNMAGSFSYGSQGNSIVPEFRQDNTVQFVANSTGKIWNGQPLSKHNNPYSHLFGVAKKDIGQDPDKSFSEEIRDLPDAYDKQQSVLLGKILISQMTATRSFWLDEICPLKKTDTTETRIKVWLFKDEYLGQVPEQGVPRLIRNNMAERSAEVTRKGLGFTNEHMFLLTPMGEQGYWMQMEQLNNACVDTAAHEIAYKIYNVEETSEYRVKNGSGLSSVEFEAVLRRNVAMWGIFQKDPKGFEIAVDKARVTMESRTGLKGNMLIIPAGSERMTWEANLTAMGVLSNQGIKLEGQWWKANGDRMVLRQSRAFHTYSDLDEDPSYTHRLIGGFTTMTMIHCANVEPEEFNLGKMCSIEIWCEPRDTFEMLYAKDAYRFTGAFPGWDSITPNHDFGETNVHLDNPFRGITDANDLNNIGNEQLWPNKNAITDASHSAFNGRIVTNNKMSDWGAETQLYPRNGRPISSTAMDDMSTLGELLRYNPDKRYAPWMHLWFKKMGWTSHGDCYNKQGLLELLARCITQNTKLVTDDDYLDLFFDHFYPGDTMAADVRQQYRQHGGGGEDEEVKHIQKPKPKPAAAAKFEYYSTPPTASNKPLDEPTRQRLLKKSNDAVENVFTRLFSDYTNANIQDRRKQKFVAALNNYLGNPDTNETRAVDLIKVLSSGTVSYHQATDVLLNAQFTQLGMTVKAQPLGANVALSMDANFVAHKDNLNQQVAQLVYLPWAAIHDLVEKHNILVFPTLTEDDIKSFIENDYQTIYNIQDGRKFKELIKIAALYQVTMKSAPNNKQVADDLRQRIQFDPTLGDMFRGSKSFFLQSASQNFVTSLIAVCNALRTNPEDLGSNWLLWQAMRKEASPQLRRSEVQEKIGAAPRSSPDSDSDAEMDEDEKKEREEKFTVKQYIHNINEANQRTVDNFVQSMVNMYDNKNKKALTDRFSISYTYGYQVKTFLQLFLSPRSKDVIENAGLEWNKKGDTAQKFIRILENANLSTPGLGPVILDTLELLTLILDEGGVIRTNELHGQLIEKAQDETVDSLDTITADAVALLTARAKELRILDDTLRAEHKRADKPDTRAGNYVAQGKQMIPSHPINRLFPNGAAGAIKRLGVPELCHLLLTRTPFTSYRFFKWVVDHNLPPCFGVIDWRPNQEWEMGSLLLTFGGGEVGKMLYMLPDFQIQNDSMRKVMIANLTVYLGCLIEDPRKITIIPDVYCKEYFGGWGTTSWDASDPRHLDEQMREPTNRDMYHTIVEAMFKPSRQWMHLNGRQPNQIREIRRSGEPEMSYSTAEYYAEYVWSNWKADESAIITNAYPGQTNTLCFQDYQGNYNPLRPDRALITHNKGPWGKDIREGTAAARAGGAKRLQEFDNQRISLVCAGGSG